jgi:hypothetical protein
MVRIQQRIAKRRYLNSKRIYHYNRQSVSIIKKFHPVSTPFLKQDLEQNVTVQNSSLKIMLTPKNRLQNAPTQELPELVSINDFPFSVAVQI